MSIARDTARLAWRIRTRHEGLSEAEVHRAIRQGMLQVLSVVREKCARGLINEEEVDAVVAGVEADK